MEDKFGPKRPDGPCVPLPCGIPRPDVRACLSAMDQAESALRTERKL